MKQKIKPFSYNGFTYRLDGSNPKEDLYINHNIKPPKDKIYKYFLFNENNIQGLLNKKIYINHPAEFNDPFDCLTKAYLNIRGTGSEVISQLLYAQLGFVCMTTNPNNLYMWAHYTGLEGYMIAFKYDQIKKYFDKIFPINYVKTLPNIELINNNYLRFIISTNLKSESWKTEKEWRFYKFNEVGYKFPKSLKYLKQFQEKEFPDERFIKYDENVIDHIVIGHKFIMNEVKKINNDKIYLKLEGIKHTLFNHLIENKISTYFLDIKSLSDFSIKSRKADIFNTKNEEYNFKIQWV